MQGPKLHKAQAMLTAGAAVMGLGAAAQEMQDMHVLLLQNIAQGCLKLQQNMAALFYATTAMRVRDCKGQVPPKAAYRAALAVWRLGMGLTIPYILAQVHHSRA